MSSNIAARATRLSARFISGVALTTTCAACAPMHLPPPPPTGTLSQTSAASRTQAKRTDSLAAQWADLEIRRGAAHATYEAWAPMMKDLDARIAAVQEQLLARTYNKATPREVVLHVLGALETRQADLAVIHRQLLTQFVSTAPVVMALQAEEQAVAARRTELGASLGLP